MNETRSAILGRLRSAQRTGRIPAAAADLSPLRAVPRSGAECLGRFLEELSALGVEHYVEASAADVRARVASTVAGRSVLSWDADRLPYDVGSVMPGALGGHSPRDAQAQAEVGVTGCDAAIAETGSLVLLTGKGKPRAASLVPPVHVAIVRCGDLHFAMDDCFQTRAHDIANAACCTVITGPSRTADIEMTLTLGVHGPGHVIVMVGP